MSDPYTTPISDGALHAMGEWAAAQAEEDQRLAEELDRIAQDQK
jgi:hypothetical protein